MILRIEWRDVLEGLEVALLVPEISEVHVEVGEPIEYRVKDSDVAVVHHSLEHYLIGMNKLNPSHLMIQRRYYKHD